jgi:radical SAM superfamily enzyme YgiQ (UPF0313 family)
MKILLINPPKHNEIRCPTPEILESSRGYNPPLGLLHIASILENNNHDVTVIDSQVEEYSFEELEVIISQASYDLLGLTVMTFSLVDSLHTSRIAKKHHPHKPIVWGGPHLHIFAEESVRFPDIDYAVTGEGETSIQQLVNHLTGELPWGKVTGVSKIKDGQYLFNGDSPMIDELDDLPFVARHLIPIHKYNSILAKGNIVTTIFTSRGCPYKCSFCDRPQLRPKFRARSAINVVDELELCYQMGIEEFIIYDDTFTVSKKRVHDICDEIIKRKLKIFWDCRTSVNAMDQSLLNHMAEAGCVGIHYGVEAGTEKIQKILRKNLKLDKVASIFDMTRRAGIKSMAYFIIGNPEETRDDIDQGFEFLKTIDPDFVHITGLLPFPATQIYIEGLRDGIIKFDYWKKFASNPDKSFVTPHWSQNFSRPELDALIIKGYKSFYLRPSYVLRRIRQIRSFSELRRNIAFGIGVLVMKMRKAEFKESNIYDFRRSISNIKVVVRNK